MGNLPALATVETFRNQVICCDATTLLRSLPDHSVDAVITDPPYGLAKYNPLQVARGSRNGQGGDYQRVNEEWDQETPLEWLDEVSRILKPGGSVVVFNGKIGLIEIGYKCLHLGWRLLAEITWYKPDAPPNFTGRCVSQSTERFLWYCPGGSNWTYNRKYAKQVNGGVNFRDVWTFYAPRGDERVHPTQKPLLLMDRIVRLFTRSGDLIVDPFAGSGTTLLAARNAERDYIGCDLSAKYVSKMRARLRADYTPDMFANSNAPEQTADPAAQQLSIFDTITQEVL